jgi:hypothetical protein
LGAAGCLTSFRGETGLAEIRVVGHADVKKVGITGTDLLAAPPLRTLVDATLRANTFTHVLYTPARLALTVFSAFVEEATFARLAGRRRGVRLEVMGGEFEGGKVCGPEVSFAIGKAKVRGGQQCIGPTIPGPKTGIGIGGGRSVR